MDDTVSLIELLFSWSNPFSDVRYVDELLTVKSEGATHTEKIWFVERDYRIEYTRGGATTLLVVPKGMPTNFASVPWFGRIVVPVSGRLTEASVVHDFCYAGKVLSRFEADWLFLTGMKAAGVRPWRRWIAYLAVRFGGARAYRNASLAKSVA